MSFEVFDQPSLFKARHGARRLKECSDMFKELSKNPEKLTAKIDTASSNVRMYAKKLGYRVSTRKISDNSCYVWINTLDKKEGK